jgi:hypothetical protein
LRYELSLTGPDRSRCLQAHRQSPSPHRLRKHAKSQGPLLRRHYPASTLLRPCPTPVLAAAFRNVEAATPADDGSPPIHVNRSGAPRPDNKYHPRTTEVSGRGFRQAPRHSRLSKTRTEISATCFIRGI